MLVIGASLLVAAALAGPSIESGGTLRLSKSTDVDYVDTALAYFTDTFGMLEYATCAKLYNYPDRPGEQGVRLIPEVAAGVPIVSREGKTYTIRLKTSYRFHTGEPVTAQSFVDAFNRDANPAMFSPATKYMHDIVGADEVIAGTAATISGISAPSTYVVRIELKQANGDLPARLALPFFCPILPNTPIDPGGIDNPAGSGPYYVAERIVNQRIWLLRNPFYTGERPANVDQIIWTIGSGQEACRHAVEADEVDYCVDGVPPTAYQELADTYEVNRDNSPDRPSLHFKPILSTGYFAFNHDREAFRGRGQIPLKKAINYAIDRKAIVGASGFLGAIATDQILPHVMTDDRHIYPLDGADVETAKKWLTRAKIKPDRLVLYTTPVGARAIRAQVLRANLEQLGIDVEIVEFSRAVQHQKCATRGEPFDICDEGWLADYPDGGYFFGPLLNGNSIGATPNQNVAYFDRPRYNRRIEQISRMQGAERGRAWADLDLEMTREDPPWASYLTFATRDFVSKRFGCYQYHPVMGIDLAAACIASGP
jgi:ABC-type oligopeptide transport system substrate-binding subunit